MATAGGKSSLLMQQNPQGKGQESALGVIGKRREKSEHREARTNTNYGTEMTNIYGM